MAAELLKGLEVNGYVYLRFPMSEEDHEMIAEKIGVVISRSDIKIDKNRELAQEHNRIVKGRPGRYSPDPLGFHTDNLKVDVMTIYCVEQDAVDGAILLLDMADLADQFKETELAILRRIELWAPDIEQEGKQETFSSFAPLLSGEKSNYRIYYIPWLLRESNDREVSAVLGRFSDYVQKKAETQIISLPVKQHESVFIDNHRMLHGRAAISRNSRRHMVRLYISVLCAR